MGYLLATVMILKILTMGSALIAMVVGQWLAGVPLEPVTTGVSGLICVLDLILAVLTLRSITPNRVIDGQRVKACAS